MQTHTPEYTPIEEGRAAPIWFWTCTCGTTGTVMHGSQEVVRLDFLGTHLFPQQERPDHTPKIFQDEVGAWCWSCACGANSYARGHAVEFRARQSHTRHVQQALLNFYAALNVRKHRIEERATKDQQRYDHLSDYGKAEYNRRALEDLL